MRIFLRLIPITMIICFVCFGITIIFNDNSLTYLQTYITGNETKIYTFDFASYIKNIDINILKRATQNVIDTKTFENIFNSWEIIWEDGYNIGDIAFTILNGFIMIIDIIILMINIPLVITRIIAGIILTGMSILGININTNGIIITALNNILDFGAIPFINPALPTTYEGATKIFFIQ